jgi:hypothetical protein
MGGSGPRAGGGKGGFDDQRCNILDEEPTAGGDARRRAGAVRLLGWFLVLGIVWTLFGMYVLSYRVGSLAAVAALVGVAFLFSGITQLAVAGCRLRWRHGRPGRRGACYRGGSLPQAATGFGLPLGRTA